jgi:hypothetical protein
MAGTVDIHGISLSRSGLLDSWLKFEMNVKFDSPLTGDNAGLKLLEISRAIATYAEHNYGTTMAHLDAEVSGVAIPYTDSVVPGWYQDDTAKLYKFDGKSWEPPVSKELYESLEFLGEV